MTTTGMATFARALFTGLLVAAACGHSNHVDAAGAAYQVDTAEVSEAGQCKVESWLSFASNRDFIAAVSPACAMQLGRPVEVSVQTTRARADDEWTTAAAPKVKVNLAPSGIGIFGLAVTAATAFDITRRENTGFALAAPVTVRLSDNMRINLNGGWLWDRMLDRHYFTYGAGFDLRTSDNVWTLTTEVFGQLGTAEVSSVVQPRFQVGMRYRPIDRFSVDLIYGRNIAGENANWITLATIIRFPPEGKAASRD